MFILIAIAIVSLMIFATALYVAAQFATVSARRTRISQLAAQGNRSAQMLLPFLEDHKALDRYVAACQVGITISSLVLGAYAQSAFATRGLVGPLSALLTELGQASSPEMAVTAAQTISIIVVLIVITALQVILGELLPKSLAIQFPEKVALAVNWPMIISLKLFTPLIWLFNGSATLILRLGHGGDQNPARAHSPEEIQLLVTESHKGGLLDDNERRMLRNAFRLRDLTVRQVMIHRTKMLVAPVDVSVSDLLKMTIDAGFSRIPLYRDTIDDIVGFVHVKDLFRLYVEGQEDVQSVMRNVLFVPETLPVEAVWRQLNSGKQYLAIAFDEFGGTAGLITFEDLVEEIFGELQDEFDDEMATIARDKEGRVYLRGDLLVSDVNEYLELDLPVEIADTLGGLVFSQLGHLPEPGEEVKFGNTVIRVETTEDFSVREVSLLLAPGENKNKQLPFSEWEVAEHD